MTRALLLLSIVALAQADYLSDNTASSFKWGPFCKSMGQQPQGYSMSMGGGTSTFHVTCSAHKITVTCTSSGCKSDYKPPATAADSPPPGKYNVKVGSLCGSGQFGRKKAQMMLDYTNKMRCVTGAPPIEWDSALECQAQGEQNKIGGFVHAHSYDLPIKSGENLATGTSPVNAAWMWFTEFLESTDYVSMCCGHFSAMAWRSVEKVGCGIQTSGKGVVRCEYAGANSKTTARNAPNFGGKSQWAKEIPTFTPSKADFTKCNLPVGEMTSAAKMFEQWGILHVDSSIGGPLGARLYSDEEAGFAMPPGGWSMAALFACVCAGMLVTGVVFVVRRNRSQNSRGLAAIPRDEEQLLEGEAPLAE